MTAAPYGHDLLCMVKGYDEAENGNVDALAVSAPDAQTFVVELSYHVYTLTRSARSQR